MKEELPIFLLILFVIIGSAPGQIHLAVTDFSNNSDVYFLDSWERSVPDLLRAELDKSTDIVVLERDKLDKLFEEQKLALAGFLDSSTVQEVGQLAGAEFIISGSVDKVGRRFRIDVNLIRVKTGEMHIEKAIAPDSDHLQEMIDLLSNNIIYFLSGKGKYQPSVSIASYPTKYFLAATVGFGTAALLFNESYRENKKNYDETIALEKFDPYYDKANNARKLSIAMVSCAGAAFIGTVYCWLKNRSIEDVTADIGDEVNISPAVSINHLNHEVMLSVQIRF